MSEVMVDSKVVKELFCEIRAAEGQNLRTGKIDDVGMRNYIERRIKDVVMREERNEV